MQERGKFEDTIFGAMAEIVSLTLFLSSIAVIAGIVAGVLR